MNFTLTEQDPAARLAEGFSADVGCGSIRRAGVTVQKGDQRTRCLRRRDARLQYFFVADIATIELAVFFGVRPHGGAFERKPRKHPMRTRPRQNSARI